MSQVRSSEPNLQLATSDLEQKVQSHEQKLKEQEELIKLLQAQLSSQQPRDQCQQQQQPKNLIKEHSTTAKQTETQHQVLKQLASLKMVCIHNMSVHEVKCNKHDAC